MSIFTTSRSYTPKEQMIFDAGHSFGVVDKRKQIVSRIKQSMYTHINHSHDIQSDSATGKYKCLKCGMFAEEIKPLETIGGKRICPHYRNYNLALKELLDFLIKEDLPHDSNNA